MPTLSSLLMWMVIYIYFKQSGWNWKNLKNKIKNDNKKLMNKRWKKITLRCTHVSLFAILNGDVNFQASFMTLRGEIFRTITRQHLLRQIINFKYYLVLLKFTFNRKSFYLLWILRLFPTAGSFCCTLAALFSPTK